MFFEPLFHPDNEITIWGPSMPGETLRHRIARYLSAPLTPVELREVPASLEFRDCPAGEWQIGSATVRAEFVNHRGPTLGYSIAEPGATFCYIPDHEPALIGKLDELDTPWISGYALARDADLLLHDCQYTDAEYPSHFGWGHSSITDALDVRPPHGAKRTLLAHHDPDHTDDELDALLDEARRAGASSAASRRARDRHRAVRDRGRPGSEMQPAGGEPAIGVAQRRRARAKPSGRGSRTGRGQSASSHPRGRARPRARGRRCPVRSERASGASLPSPRRPVRVPHHPRRGSDRPTDSRA